MISKSLGGLLISASTFFLLSCGGGGSSGNSAQSVNTPQPVPPPQSTIITLEGQAWKGLAYGARIVLFESNSAISGNTQIIAETMSSSTDGRYSLSLDKQDIANIGDYLVLAAVLNDTEMLCDAPLGCGDGIQFGDVSQVRSADSSIPVTPLYAIFPTPDGGTTTTVNPNIFSGMEFTYHDYLVGSGNVTFNPQNLAQAQTRITKIFGLSDTPLYKLPFVDITKEVTSSDSNAIRAALIAGGLHGDLHGYDGIADRGVGFEWGMFYLFNDFYRDEGEISAHENNDFVFVTSLEDMFYNAKAIEGLNNTSTNAYETALQSVKDTYEAIKASEPYARTLNGELQPRGPNQAPEFLDTYYQAKDGDAGPIKITVFDPNGIEEEISFHLNSGQDADFFTLSAFGELTPSEAFDCAEPQDVDQDHIYHFSITISDGEFEVTEDLRLEIFTQDGNYCPGYSGSAKPLAVKNKAIQAISLDTLSSRLLSRLQTTSLDNVE